MARDLEYEAKRRRSDPIYSSTYEADLQKYIESMKNRVVDQAGKCFDTAFGDKKNTECCASPQKYKNIFNNLKFWSCKNCGADLGDIED